MNIFRIIKYQLYLLQLENYQLGRYFRLLFKKGLWPKGEQRKSLVWTRKARLVFILAVLLHFSLTFLIFWVLTSGFSVLSIKYYVLIGAVFLVWYTLYFILYTFSLLFIWPIDFAVKYFIIWQAKIKIKMLSVGKPINRHATGQHPGLKIIGIAGSYGKTTMKEVLKQVLGARFKVLATPESVNTPVGIARWVLKEIDETTEILIAEMGEHYEGDITEICEIVKPDIAVVTGINESHLERMKKMDTVINTIFEIVSNAKPGAMVVLNGDDKNVINNYKKYAWPDHKLAIYGQRNDELRIMNYEFNTEKLCWEVEAEGLGKFDINLLGEYALGDADAAIKIAESLGMTAEEIKNGIEKIQPVEHRLQPLRSAGNILVIDDSYNGNPDGVTEAIKVLARLENRRKIFITPGLVEMGKAAPDIHREIGRQLASVADVVILIKNSVSGDIEVGIKNYELRMGGKKPEIIIFDSVTEAHASLPKILQHNDVIVFQNDWGDQYV